MKYLAAAIIGLLLLMGGVYFYQHLEEHTEWIYHPPAEDTVRKDYLAADRVLTRLERPPVWISTLPELRQLPRHSVLMLLDQNDPDTRQVEALQHWVRQGGHLIIGYEDLRGETTLLSAFGLSLTDITHEENNAPQDAGKDQMIHNPGERLLGPAPLGELSWEPQAGQALSPDTPGTHWGNEDDLLLVDMPVGQGHLTALPTTRLFKYNAQYSAQNEGYNFWGSLDRQQHATLLYQLTRLHYPEGTLALLPDLRDPSLWGWLVRNANRVLWVFLAWLLIWLGRIIPRVGTLLPEAPRARRSLLEHLSASGRYLWQRRGHAILLDAIRHRIQQRLRRRHPHLAVLHGQSQLVAIAEHTGLPLSQLQTALIGLPPQRHELLQALQTLQRLYRRL